MCEEKGKKVEEKCNKAYDDGVVLKHRTKLKFTPLITDVSLFHWFGLIALQPLLINPWPSHVAS